MITHFLLVSFRFRWLTSLHRQCLVVNSRVYLPSLILAGTADAVLAEIWNRPSALLFHLQQTTTLPPTTHSI